MIPDNARILVADTETTGVNDDDQVCELGWIEIDDNFNIIDEHQSLIDCQRMIPPGASAVHGLVYDDVKDSPTINEYFSEADPSCYGKKITDPVILVGHNIRFDTRFLKDYINVVQELCTLRWSRRLYPDADNHQLGTMIFNVGLPRSEGAHRVMGDIMTSYHLLRHVSERTGLSVRQLAEASAQPMEVTFMPFGKHKGEKLTDVPRSYLSWMLNKMDGMDPDLRHSAKILLDTKTRRTGAPA